MEANAQTDISKQTEMFAAPKRKGVRVQDISPPVAVAKPKPKPKSKSKSKSKSKPKPKPKPKPERKRDVGKPGKPKRTGKPGPKNKHEKSSGPHRSWNYDFVESEVIGSFAKNLRELRTAKGISQQHLSDEIGYSRIAVCNMERGANGATIATLLRIASVLGCTPNDLLKKRAVSS